MGKKIEKDIIRKEFGKYGTICICAFIFALSINLFIVPLGLYSSGVLGIAQILRSLIDDAAGSWIPHSVDIAGIINFIINIPLFFIAFRTISKNFFFKTLLSVICQMAFMTVIHIPSDPILEDVLANCLIGGLLGGAAMGFTLRASGCGGGLDILGVYFTKKYENFSVGKLGIMVNAGLYLICAVLFDVPTAIYSVIYTACFTLAVDKTHVQNINVTCLIFSKEKNDEIQQEIMSKMHRGITIWRGSGAYTGEETYIMAVVISKYEKNQIKNVVRKSDRNAFLIFFEGTHVSGNFEKRL